MIAIFLFSFASASSKFASVPDLHLQQNITGLNSVKVWLWDYFNIDQSEVIHINYLDPISGRMVHLPANYASLNLKCFEVSYGFQNRGHGWYEDVLVIQTLNDTCQAQLMIDFTSNDNLDTTFNLYVNNSYKSGYSTYDPAPVYTNTTGTLFSHVKHYFPFDSSMYDAVTDSAGQVQRAPLFSPGLFGNSLNARADVSYSLIGSLLSDLNPSNFSVSFWYEGNYSTSMSVLNCSYFGSNVFINNMYFANATGLSYSVGNLNNSFHLVTASFNSTGIDVYGDGIYKGFLSGSIPSLSYCHVGDNEGYAPDGKNLIDDLVFWDTKLNSADVTYLYNNGKGRNMTVASPYIPHQNSLFPDIQLNGSSSAFVNISQYYTNWSSIYVAVDDPISDFSYTIYPGYGTLNADYFEIYNLASALNITSYARPYSFDVSVYVCGTSVYTDCILDLFHVSILSNVSNVLSVSPFLYSYTVDPTFSFSGNSYFQYYDTITLSLIDSNDTGVLDGDFNYSVINDSSYLVYLPCNITKSPYVYNYSGDYNISVSCGSGQSYFTFYSAPDYLTPLSFTAFNNRSSLSGNTFIISASHLWASGNIPTDANSSSTGLTNNWYSFGNLLPQDLSSVNEHRLVFLVLFIVVVLIMVTLYSKSFALAVHLSVIAIIFILFLFASQSYVTLYYPVFFLFLYLAYIVLKIWKGG